MEGDVVTLQDVFVFDFAAGRGRRTGVSSAQAIPTGVRPRFTDRFDDRGIVLSPAVFGAPANARAHDDSRPGCSSAGSQPASPRSPSAFVAVLGSRPECPGGPPDPARERRPRGMPGRAAQRLAAALDGRGRPGRAREAWPPRHWTSPD